MSTTEATIAETPASTAPEVDNDALSDAALEKVFGEQPESEGLPDVDSEPEGNASDAATQLAAASEGKTTEEKQAEGIDLSLLKDEDEPAQPSAEDAHIKTIKEFLPNETAVRTLVEAAQKTTALNQAIQTGDFNGVYRALGTNAEAFIEMFYQAAKDKLVERYIEESKGQTQDPRYNALEQKFAQLESFIASGVQQQRQVAQTAAQKRSHEALNTAIERDLNTARFPDDEFHKVQRDLLKQSVIADLAMAGNLQKALAGDMKLVRGALRTRLTALVEADKKRQTVQTTKRAQLETTKPIISGEAANKASATTSADGKIDYAQKASDWLESLIKRGK